MFYHRNMAVLGLWPQLVTTEAVANQGHLQIEVIIQETGGGSTFYEPIGLPKRYTVYITATDGINTWKTEVPVDDFEAKVVADFLEIEVTEPTVVLTGYEIIDDY